MGWDGWVVIVEERDGKNLWAVWSDDRSRMEKWATREFNRYSRTSDNPKWSLQKMDVRDFLKRMPKGHLILNSRVLEFEENRTLTGALA